MGKRSQPSLRIILNSCLILLLAVPMIHAQQITPESHEPVLTLLRPPTLPGVEELKARRDRAADTGNLPEDVEGALIKFLDQAIAFREEAAKIERETQEIIQLVTNAPVRLEEIQKILDQPLTSPERFILSESSSLSSDEIDRRRVKEEADLAKAVNTLRTWKEALAAQKSTVQTLPQQIANAKKRFSDLQQKGQKGAPPDEPPEVAEARRLAAAAEEAKIKAEIDLLDQQLTGYETLASLLAAEGDLAAHDVSRREASVKAWQAAAQDRLRQEATRITEEAKQAKEASPRLLTAVEQQFDINIALSAALEPLIQEEAELVTQQKRLATQLEELDEEFALARERVELNRLGGEAVGLALREQRQALPTIDDYRRGSEERQKRMSEIREAQIEYRRLRRDLTVIDAAVDQIMSTMNFASVAELTQQRTQLGELLNTRRDLLGKLEDQYRRSFKTLSDIEFAEQQLAAKSKEFADFLDGKLLWIRSSESFNLGDLSKMMTALRWMMKPDHWLQLALNGRRAIGQHTALWILAGLIGIALLVSRGRMKRSLSDLAARVRKPQQDGFALTLRAIGLTTLLAVGWPLLMAFAALQMQALPLLFAFGQIFSEGLLTVSKLLALWFFLYCMCCEDGLAQAHFMWSRGVRLTIRRNLVWFMPLTAVTSFFISGIGGSTQLEFSDALGKVALMVNGIGVALFLAVTLKFSGEIMSSVTRGHPDSWLVRLWYAWYPAAVGIPLLLVVLAEIGYFYSAMEVYDKIRSSVWLVISLILFRSLALRWLTISRRKIAVQRARRIREMKLAEAKAEKSNDRDDMVQRDAIDIEVPEIGLAQIGEQTTAMLRTVVTLLALSGLWAIWAPLFTSVEVLRNVELWSYTSQIDGVAQTVPISLASLLIAVVVLITTILAFRNLPGLTEMILLRHLPMDFGARYAFTTVMRYAIVAIGVIVCLNTIGFRWSSMQWLIAALGVGLGFGLQEIVANFVSGLIVLFERPFRVGDTVTIGEITGTVSRVRMRATTVVDWDRRELIVPNKEFITGRLVNWSLSDNVIRIVVPVGIAYGSDTARAEELLVAAARENPLVLSDPAAFAVFKGFGDNSLNFEVRVYINGINDWIPMLHRLNRTIDQKFREAGITISFPQRDVHLDTSQPLEVRVVSGEIASEVPDRTVPRNAAARLPVESN